jgi:hypothetical protein
MDFRSYVLGLFTIVSGLAVTEVAQRLARLIALRRKVRWDWLPLVATAVILCSVAVAWGRAWFSMEQAQIYHPSFVAFLLTLAAYILLYITAAASLPADISEGLDLKAFYRDQCGEFWTLYSVVTGQFVARTFLLPAIQNGGLAATEILTCALTTLTLLIPISLAAFQNRRWHMIGAPLALVVIIGPNMLRPF